MTTSIDTLLENALSRAIGHGSWAESLAETANNIRRYANAATGVTPPSLSASLELPSGDVQLPDAIASEIEDRLGAFLLNYYAEGDTPYDKARLWIVSQSEEPTLGNFQEELWEDRAVLAQGNDLEGLDLPFNAGINGVEIGVHKPTVLNENNPYTESTIYEIGKILADSVVIADLKNYAMAFGIKDTRDESIAATLNYVTSVFRVQNTTADAQIRVDTAENAMKTAAAHWFNAQVDGVRHTMEMALTQADERAGLDEAFAKLSAQYVDTMVAAAVDAARSMAGIAAGAAGATSNIITQSQVDFG